MHEAEDGDCVVMFDPGLTNSMVIWLAREFIDSWRNVDMKLEHETFDDFGPRAALTMDLKNWPGRTAMEMAELVEAPEFILEGLRGNREECEKHLPPCMAEKLWISV